MLKPKESTCAGCLAEIQTSLNFHFGGQPAGNALGEERLMVCRYPGVGFEPDYWPDLEIAQVGPESRFLALLSAESVVPRLANLDHAWAVIVTSVGNPWATGWER